MARDANYPRRAVWFVPASVIAAAVLLVALSPVERTLGAGIRIVYVHVALTWAGMAGFALAGLLGVFVLISPARPAAVSWMQAVGRAAAVTYTAGFVVSMAAEQINWGGIYWNEPRTIAALQITAVAIIVHVVNAWLPAARLRALLNIVLFVFVMWRGRVESLLHPDNAASASDSSPIQLTFLAMFVLCFVGMLWLTWYLRAARDTPESPAPHAH